MIDQGGRPLVVVVMGVAGCGKTTIGRLLGAAIGADFEEGDFYHPPANVAKMSSGTPLTDADREPWLVRLSNEIDTWIRRRRRVVLACSALKRTYRETLAGGHRELRFVHLIGDYDLIRARLDARSGHYMPPDLLESQFQALEPPAAAVAVEVSGSPAEILTEIRHATGWW